MSYEKDFLTGIAQMIADNGIATYKPSGAYSAGQTGIVFGGWPQVPDRCLTLNYTPVTDQTMSAFGRGILDIGFRGAPGDPFGPSDIAVPVFELIHGMRQHTLGTAEVIQILRDHVAPMETDGNRRNKRFDLYYVDLASPTTKYRTD
ncbi:hypothetical protein [Paenarthrobacter sp. A20]|uniref:hypothetical protein n=1 Tax=Paenarthrobacter sp. A20 TaxID=2817891 RepID=UPI00209E8194|nr:hypothetical protein [Paenarthrobacter sp. A20]MCP1414406.1 hypothetical protein [Paenarthrobacter sp. A20]